MFCSYRLSAWFRHGCSQAPECAHCAGLHGRHLLPRLNRSSSPKHRHRAHQRENRTTQRHRGWWQTGEYADQQRQWRFFPTPRVQYQAEGCHEFQRVYAVQSYLPHKHCSHRQGERSRVFQPTQNNPQTFRVITMLMRDQHGLDARGVKATRGTT